MNKHIIIYALLLATILLSALSRVAHAQTWGADGWFYLYWNGPPWREFNPSWTILMSNNTEQTKSGGGYAELESTNVTDFIHPDAYDNSTSRQVFGFFAVFDINVIEAGSGSSWIWLQAKSTEGNRTCIGIDPYNTTHYRLVPMPEGYDPPFPRTGFLQEGEWYDLEWHGGQNQTIASGSAITYSWIKVWRTYPTDSTESNATHGPGSYKFTDVVTFQQWSVGGPAVTKTRDRDYYYIPSWAGEGNGNGEAEIYWTEPRMYIMFLFIGLGMILIPPSYIAWQKPPVSTIVMLLFVMVIGMGLLISVAHYTA